MMGWRERNVEHPNYPRMHYAWREHHARFVAHVEAHGLPCQDCGTRGGYVEVVCEGQGPWYDCDWCEGTGLMTRWLRGLWLRFKRDEARRRLHGGAARTEGAA
jgi:hypothetical protein